MSPIAIPEAHRIELEVFDGPLDLLLYLIKKNEIDIYDIPIEQVADQYIEYLNLMRMLDLNIAGEFIVMASTLMLIKSRMLLPPEERPEMEEEEEDPRWELVRQLIEYRKFKDAASFLQERETVQENVFAVGGDVVELDENVDAGLTLTDVGIFDLITAFNAALKRLPEETFDGLYATVFSVSDKIESVLNAVKTDKTFTFSSILAGATSRQEIACLFLAVLELLRMRHIVVSQDHHFGEIMIAGYPE
ncbi:MAG: chromosome segregation protein ScpA [Lentisphaerales bacterium]|jgi:segregation and condensation protein A|nr:MAG: chromosome segregation protein ScpA [Lentisphaerales bacterium]